MVFNLTLSNLHIVSQLQQFCDIPSWMLCQIFTSADKYFSVFIITEVLVILNILYIQF